MTDWEELFEDGELLVHKLTFGTASDLMRMVEELMDDLGSINFDIQTMKIVEKGDKGEIWKKRRLLRLLLMKLGELSMETAPKIDVREKNVEIIELFLESGFKMIQLEHGKGDYESGEAGGKTINFERKEDDFLGSLFSGRLHEQLLSMYENHDCNGSFLVVTKSYDWLKFEADNRGMHPNVLPGTVAGLALMGFPPLFIDTNEETVKIIKMMCDKFQNNPTHAKVINRCVNIHSHNIVTFPGVGDVIGLRMIEHFGSIRGVCNASVEELLDVKGVGKKTAEHVYALCNGDDEDD